MPRIELSEGDSPDTLPYIVAALGRVTNPLNVELYERLYDTMTASEMAEYHRLEREMEFSVTQIGAHLRRAAHNANTRRG